MTERGFSPRLFSMNVLNAAFKKTLESYFSVIKPINLYFGFYFIGGSILVILTLNFFFPSAFSLSAWDWLNNWEEPDTALSFQASEEGFFLSSIIRWGSNSILNMLGHIFIAFMVPYYAFKHWKGSAPDFWSFIRESVLPLVLIHILAGLVIFFFFLLLILPGFYKLIRYTFVTETVFFDSLYREGEVPALRASSQITKGYFWWLVVFLLIKGFFWWLSALANGLFFLSPLSASILSLVVTFYLSCFLLLFRACLYFELKERKGESISCRG